MAIDPFFMFIKPPKPARERALDAARRVEALSKWLLVLGVIGGILIAFQSEENGLGGHVRHPYVGAGVALAVASIFQGLVIVMIATYIQSRIE